MTITWEGNGKNYSIDLQSEIPSISFVSGIALDTFTHACVYSLSLPYIL